MTPLPKRRHSSRRQAKRSRALTGINLTWTKCPQCQKMCLPHRVCPHCGFYNQQAVVVKKDKQDKSKTNK